MSDIQARKILLVEDDDFNLVVMAKLFRSHGYTVHTAPTAGAAATLAAVDRFDLVVCDLGLPDRDGAELMRDLKAMYGLKGFALTGHTGPEVVQAVIEAGFEKHFAKPVIFKDLMAAVRELIGDAAAGPPG